MKLNFASIKIKNKIIKCAIVKSMFASIPIFAQELPNSPEKVISENKMTKQKKCNEKKIINEKHDKNNLEKKIKHSNNEEIYENIKSILIASAPKKATKIIIRVNITDKIYSPSIYWFSSNGKREKLIPECNSEIQELFTKLRKLNPSGKNQEKFSYSEMIVNPKDGKYKIHFKYKEIEIADWNQFNKFYKKEMNLEKELPPGRDQEIFQELSDILISSVDKYKDVSRIQFRAVIQEDYFAPKYRWYKSNGDKNYFIPNDDFQVTYLSRELKEYFSRLSNQAGFTYLEINIDPNNGKFTSNFNYEKYDLGEWLALDKLPE